MLAPMHASAPAHAQTCACDTGSGGAGMAAAWLQSAASSAALLDNHVVSAARSHAAFVHCCLAWCKCSVVNLSSTCSVMVEGMRCDVVVTVVVQVCMYEHVCGKKISKSMTKKNLQPQQQQQTQKQRLLARGHVYALLLLEDTCLRHTGRCRAVQTCCVVAQRAAQRCGRIQCAGGKARRRTGTDQKRVWPVLCVLRVCRLVVRFATSTACRRLPRGPVPCTTHSNNPLCTTNGAQTRRVGCLFHVQHVAH